MMRFFNLFICLLSILLGNGFAQYDVEYERLFIGKFNTYAHQIQGTVYAIDEYTLLIRNFYYDGNGKDTFFWAGSTNRPSNVGFIVPDDEKRTNRLPAYIDKDFTLTLPDRKKITEIKWLSVYDLINNNNFADVYIPEGFNVPAPQKLSGLSRKGGGVKSGNVVIINSRTIEIPDFHFKYTGANVFFWVGNGSFPRAAGRKIPDENGYLNPLRSYDGKDIRLVIPGELSVFKINWLSVWNVDEGADYGSISIPDGLHVPPSLMKVLPQKELNNCQQLHRDLQIGWYVDGTYVTFTILANIDDNDYVALGLSGSEEKSQMINSDVLISYMFGLQGKTDDYNITAKAPCTNQLGRYKGVCPDLRVQGFPNAEAFQSVRKDGISEFKFRRQMINYGDSGDKIFDPDREQYYVWAIGKLNSFYEPGYHHIYPKSDVKLQLGKKGGRSDCFEFTSKVSRKSSPWGPFKISDKNLDTFTIRVGPAGGHRGYYGHTGVPSGSHAFYVNGLLAPELYVKRGQKYKFVVEAGNNPHDVLFYHPFYITENPNGAFSSLKPEEIKEEKLKMITGIKFSRRGRPQPTTAGRLCLWILDEYSPREADDFSSFAWYREEMTLHCDKGNPATLTWTPNITTPDLLYYQSYSHKHMGWKIHVVDEILSGASSISCSKFYMLLFSISYFILYFM